MSKLFHPYDSIWLGVLKHFEGLPWCISGKDSACDVGDTGLISVLGGSHMPWSNEAPGPPLLSRCPRALEPRLLSPHSQEPRPARREAATTRSLCAETTEWPLPITSRESPHSNKDPAQPEVKLLKKFFCDFWQPPQITNSSQTSSNLKPLWGTSKGPCRTPKKDPRLMEFICYVKLHGKHCPNLLLPVLDRIIRLPLILS